MYKKYSPLILCICIGFLITSCTSTGFLGVLTTNTVLERRLAESEMKQDQKLQELKETVSDIQSGIEEIQKITGKLNEMIDTIDKTETTTKELQEMAEATSQRLDDLPMETLKELVEILKKAIKE